MSPSCLSKRPAISTVSKLSRKAWCKKHAWRAGPPTLRRPMIRMTLGLAPLWFSRLTDAGIIGDKLAGYRSATKLSGLQRFDAKL